jgi:YVTN family beta-propeller protein
MRGEVSRVDLQFNRVTKTVSVASPSSLMGSTAVGEGAVWAAFGDSTLARIEPVDVTPASSNVGGRQPSAIVVGNGAIWVADVGDSTVKRFNPATFEQGAVRQYGVGSRPLGIAFGEGAIWVANASDDSVTRIDPFTGSSRTIAVGRGPTAVAVGSGAVWVSNTADATVSRIDSAANEVVETIEIGNAPYGLVVNGDLVWVAVQAP